MNGDLILGLKLSVMFRPLSLRKHHLLPEYTEKIARVTRDNQPVERARFEALVRGHESLDMEDVPSSIRMLRMKDNLEIEDGKARIKSHCCKGVGNSVMGKFRRWKREAQNS
jgi:hypothetical protein